MGFLEKMNILRRRSATDPHASTTESSAESSTDATPIFRISVSSHDVRAEPSKASKHEAPKSKSRPVSGISFLSKLFHSDTKSTADTQSTTTTASDASASEHSTPHLKRHDKYDVTSLDGSSINSIPLATAYQHSKSYGSSQTCTPTRRSSKHDTTPPDSAIFKSPFSPTSGSATPLFSNASGCATPLFSNVSGRVTPTEGPIYPNSLESLSNEHASNEEIPTVKAIKTTRANRAPTSISNSYPLENSDSPEWVEEELDGFDTASSTSSSRKDWRETLQIAVKKAQKAAILDGKDPAEFQAMLQEVLSDSTKELPPKLSKGSAKKMRNESSEEDSESGSRWEDSMADSMHTQFSMVYDQVYEEGKAFARAGQYHEAIECYNKAFDNGIKPQYYHKIALSYYFLGDMLQAEKYCHDSATLDENYYKVYQTLSAIYRHKYSQSKVEGNSLLASEYKKISEKYLNQYKRSIQDNSPHDQAAALVEQSLMSIAADDDLQNVNAYLKEAHIQITKQQNLISIDTLDSNGEEEIQKYESQLELIKQITLCTEVPVSESEASTKITRPSEQWTPKTKKIVQNVLEKFKLSPHQKQLNELKDQMAQLNKNFEQLREQCVHYVTYAEVSMAVKRNPHDERADQQMKEIEGHIALKQYFHVFVSTIADTHVSSMVISKGDVAIDTSSVVTNIVQQLLSLIPIYGHMVGTGITSLVEFAKEVNIKNEALNFRPIATDGGDLNNKVWSAARAITLYPSKQEQIFSPPEDIKVKGFLNKILSHIGGMEHMMVKKIYGDLYDTHAKRLGYEDACEVISQYIKIQKEAKKHHTQPMNDGDIIGFITHAVIPNFISDDGAISMVVTEATFYTKVSVGPVDAPREPVDAPREPVDAPREPVDAPREPVDAPREPVDVEPRGDPSSLTGEASTIEEWYV